MAKSQEDLQREFRIDELATLIKTQRERISVLGRQINSTNMMVYERTGIEDLRKNIDRLEHYIDEYIKIVRNQ